MWRRQISRLQSIGGDACPAGGGRRERAPHELGRKGTTSHDTRINVVRVDIDGTSTTL